MGRDVISMNTTHYQGANMYKIRFPQAVSFKGAKLSLYSFSMYNSTYNISQSIYSNSKITFTWFDGSIYNWFIPDGYYSVSDLNIWLQSQFVTNNLYFTNITGSTFYYCAVFQTNSTQYKNEIDIYYVPNSTTSGYLKPSSATWNFPATNTMVQLTINPNLLSYFGMSSRLTFGNEIVVKNYQYLSDTFPVISPVFSYYLTANIICSSFNQVAGVFSQFPINVAFGQLIQVNTVMDSRLDIKDGLYNELIIQLWDQNFNPLKFQDPELTLFLIVET